MLQEEIRTQKLKDYSKNELVLMLQNACFEEIRILGDYGDEPDNADHENLTFLGKK